MDPIPHPEFAAHDSFEHLRLGRSGIRHDPRTLQFARYIDESILPQIPPAASFAYDVPSWPMYGNDRLGDCTCAAVGHMIQAWTAAAGGEKTPAEADVLEAYIPGTGADDTGRMELDVLNYWRKTGVGGDKILAYAAIDPGNVEHVRAAIWLFGGVYTGIALPRTAQRQVVWDLVGDGKSGDSQPGSWGGHAVPYEEYDQEGFTVVTWGGTLKLTDAFHSGYTDEVYAVLSTDLLNAGKTPQGFDLATLQADLAAIGSPA